MPRILCVLPFLLLSYAAFAQVYYDFIGAGQQTGVKVSSSPNINPDSSAHTISGTSLIPDMVGAARFLSQATLGTNYEQIESLSEIGIDTWLSQQFSMTPSSFVTRYDSIYAIVLEELQREDHLNEYGSFVFYDFIFNDSDYLRQKVAFALSQIFVINRSGDLSNEAAVVMSFHDILYQNAFGNYRDLLGEVTYSLSMSIYLSYLNNRRADIINNTFPDENYAREIMQLFSIGLDKLNLDGTAKLDADGNTIPTYTIENIEELSKVFTGLTFTGDPHAPVIMDESLHSIGSKNIFDDIVIPEGQAGIQDIEDALDELFKHSNVGPFIGYRLIQQLVKSNPTPAYVRRVAMIFNDNGKGVRGDLEAVVKAILLDPEARNCEWIDHPENGKLIQPLERLITLYKAFDIDSPTGRLWFDDERGNPLSQSFQNAPSVFNFYSPFYAEDNIIAPQGLVSPEFQILNSITSIEYLNTIEDVIKKQPFANRTKSNVGVRLVPDDENIPFLDFTDEIEVYQTEGVEALLNRLDVLICRGQLSQRVKDIIADTITQNIENVNNYDETDIIHDALYYIFMSPDYMIQK